LGRMNILTISVVGKGGRCGGGGTAEVGHVCERGLKTGEGGGGSHVTCGTKEKL
jgi:hypothetical protein